MYLKDILQLANNFVSVKHILLRISNKRVQEISDNKYGHIQYHTKVDYIRHLQRKRLDLILFTSSVEQVFLLNLFLTF